MADNVRLLQCLDCKTLEQLDDYEGDPSRDVLLETLISRHKFPDGNPHRGHLHRVERKHWDSKSTRRAIENQIREASGHTGFDTEFYETKNTFQEDALACWQKHLRNPGCNDYKSDRMELQPATSADRKEAGVGKYQAWGAQRRYLCEYCPVHSLVQQAARSKAGLDK